MFCTKAAFSAHKPLQAVEPNVEFEALLRDVYNEMIHNAQYQGGAATLRSKHYTQHILDLNVSPHSWTCQLPMSREAEMLPK